MKKTKLITAFVMMLCGIAGAQTLPVAPVAQQKIWYISPKKIDVTTNTVSVTPIAPGSPVTTQAVPNGVYDAAGALLFYIADNAVYDYNNTLLGYIYQTGAEVIIVPFGTNNSCQSKFNIISCGPGVGTTAGLYRSVLDMKSFSLTAPENIDNASTLGSEFGAIAVGKANASGDRFLYFIAGSGYNDPTGKIDNLIVYNNGSIGAPTLVYPTTPYVPAGLEVFARDLELSPNGDYLAWASYEPASTTYKRYHYLKLSGGNYVAGSYTQFNIPGITGNTPGGFRGVEFYQSGTTTRLFMGAGANGIYYTVPPATGIPTTFTQVQGSFPANSFGFSQIETAYNTKMYATQDGVGYVGAFDPSIANPIMLGLNISFNLPNPPFDNYTLSSNPPSKMYTLPDQIDGEDYSILTPPVVPHVITTNTLNYPATTATNQTATWTYGSTTNPLGATAPVQIVKELHVRQNSNLTINGMIFKFSHDAKVIIDAGSTLTINGTTFTSNYGSDGCTVPYTWKGVYVVGNKFLGQNAVPLVEGKLIMTNSSKIEYAETGVSLWDRASTGTSGGILVANSSSIFSNCACG